MAIKVNGKHLLLASLAGVSVLNFGVIQHATGTGGLVPGRAASAAGRSPSFSPAAAPARPRAFLDVLTYREGIGAWRASLQELLSLAEGISSSPLARAPVSLVEPCMRDGRLYSCGGAGRDGGGVPASDIFDLSWAVEFSDDGRPPLMISHKEYEEELRGWKGEVRTYELCFADSPSECQKALSALKSTAKYSRSDIREGILGSDPNRLTVLRIHDYWLEKGVNDLKWTANLALGRDYSAAPRKQLQFHPRHVRTVRDVLEARAGVVDGAYSVVHWRAEREGMNYTRCAEAVREARWSVARRLGLAPDHPFVLTTSLNEDPGRMWDKAREAAGPSLGTAATALRSLVDGPGGFLRFDDLLRRGGVGTGEDPGMLAVYDLILASRAEGFASCARDGKEGCTGRARDVCKACNHVGKFGQLAIKFRRELKKPKKSSHECWPQDDETESERDPLLEQEDDYWNDSSLKV